MAMMGRTARLPSSILEKVQAAWAPVSQDLGLSGSLWLGHVCDVPAISKALGPGAKEAMLANPAVRKEADKAIRTVDTVINGLKKEDALLQYLRNLAVRYAQAGVHPHHFETIELSLMALIAAAHGGELGEDVREACLEALGYVRGVMIPSLVLAHKENEVVAMLKRTWKAVGERPEEHGEKMFLKMFELDPSLIDVFGMSGVANPASSPKMRVHAAAVVEALGNAVNSMDNVRGLIDMLRALAGKHAGAGLQPDHWVAFGEAMLWMLEGALGPAWQVPGTSEGWQQMWATIRSVMEPSVTEAEQRVRAGSANSSPNASLRPSSPPSAVRPSGHPVRPASWGGGAQSPQGVGASPQVGAVKRGVTVSDSEAAPPGTFARNTQLVQSSWKIVERNLEECGMVLLLRMFEVSPGLLHLFSFKGTSDLEESSEFRKHAATIMRAIGTAVMGLSDTQAITPTLQDLGGRHAKYGVLPEHLPVFGGALMWMLEQELGIVWIPEVQRAWKAAWEVVQGVLDKALVSGVSGLSSPQIESSGKRQARIVQESWRIVERDLDAHGVIFFTRLFEIAPGALQLFSFKDKKDLETDPAFQAHASEVMHTVGTAVAGLSDVNTLIPVLQALGGRHAGYGVQSEHFVFVGQALLWTLEQALGTLWTSEVKSAWTKTYGTLKGVMEPALEAERQRMTRQGEEEGGAPVASGAHSVASSTSTTATEVEDDVEKRKRLVRASWRLVERDLDAHGVKFFKRIFKIAPGALKLFSFRDSKDLDNDPRMRKHASTVLHTVGTAVAGLNNLQSLIPVLRSLGTDHAKYGVRPSHFPIIGQALLWTLRNALGDAWSNEVRDAWMDTFQLVQSVMEPALAAESERLKALQPKKSLEEHNRSLVQSSWMFIEKDLDAHGVKFFKRIFEIAPGALQLFSFKDSKDLDSDPRMQHHASTVMKTVGTAVAGLNDVESLIPVLQALGARHSKWGVLPEHFPVVGSALLWALEQGLGAGWTPEVREAWTETYGTVQSVMEPALVAANEKAKQEGAGVESAEDRKRRLVQASWKLVEKDLDAHGVKFFKRIFEIAPGALQLFSFRDSADLDNDPRMRKHANNVMRTVGTAVAGLADVKFLIPVLRSLGGVHATYGVQPEHFSIVGQALLWTLEQGLGKIWTPEVRDAWTATYATVQSVMEPALIAAYDQQVKRAESTGLRQMGLVQESWELVEKDLDTLGIKFFQRIFELSPGILQLFSFKDAEDLYNDPRLQMHSSSVMRTMGQAVAGLADVNSLIPVLQGLGITHSKYGVEPGHFPVLGQALMWTLEKGLADKWTPEVREAWAKTYATVQSVMEQALVKAYKDRAASGAPSEQGSGAASNLAASSPNDSFRSDFAPSSQAMSMQSGGVSMASQATSVSTSPRDSFSRKLAGSMNDVALVQTSWMKIEENLDAHGTIFFDRFLKLCPDARILFPFSDEAGAAKRDEKLRRHASNVLKTVGQVVVGFNDIKLLFPILSSLGRRHGKYGVEEEYFTYLGEALLWTIEQGLDDEWSEDVRNAWSNTYEAIRAVMMKSIEQVQEPRYAPAVIKVKRSWAIVEKDLDKHGVRFFLKIFELAPEALQLFPFRNDADLAASPKLKPHATNVLRTVGQAVAGLTDIEKLEPVLKSLGGSHAQYGVQPEHFLVIQKALLWTLEQALGDVWHVQLQEAWLETFMVVQGIMRPALVAAQADAAKDKGGVGSEDAGRSESPEVRQMRLVQASWKLVEKDLDAHGVKFFKRMFEIAPGALQLFGFKDSKDLDSDPRMRHHASTVMHTVGTAVAGLADVKTLIPVLQALGANHAKYGVQPEHFPIVGNALLWALEKALGQAWMPEVRDAWAKTYATVQGVMEASLVDAHAKSAAAPAAPAERAPERVEPPSKENPELRAMRLVQESWKLVERDLDGHGRKLFKRMFEIAPETLQLFSFKDSKNLDSDERMAAHAVGVMKAVGMAVKGLSDVKALVPVLQKLGASHAKWGVQPEHFPIVGSALLWTLEQGLGAVWTPELKSAWAKTYATVQSVMEVSLKQAKQAQARPQLKRQESTGAKQIRLVQDSWRFVEKDLDSHGIKFFLRVFELAPELLQLFSFRDAKDLAKSPAMAKHAGAVMRTVGQAVAGFRDVQTLIPMLQALGGVHAKYGVRPEHFAIVGEALLWTLGECLGDRWTMDVSKAWETTYGAIQTVMQTALVQAQKQGDRGPKQMELVQASWKLVEKDLEAHGIKFFKRIFEAAPEALQLFSFKDSKDLDSDPRMHKHAATVLRTVGVAVLGLADVKTLIPVLQALGANHAKYGVQPEHFPIVGNALLWTLEQALGTVWTREVREAWAKTYATVQSVMEPALIAANEKAKQENKVVESAEDRKRRLVQASWKLVEKDLDAHSVKFFKRIFEIAPGALQLFSFKDSKDLDSDPRMRHHASTVMKTVGTAVAGLNDLQSLIPVLQALGARHSKWGVLPEHFPIVGSALLWALEQGLGAGWTPEVREAWTETYGTVQSVMEPALVAANEKARQEADAKETPEQRKTRLVQASWTLVEKDLDAHGVKFFKRIFEIAPGALQLFSFRDSADLDNDPRMQKHANNVMRTVGTAVAGLADVKTLMPVLQSLGSVHSKYGVQPEHFSIVGQALLWTLEQGLVKIWTPEVRDAWTATFATVQSVMEPALISANEKARQEEAIKTAAAVTSLNGAGLSHDARMRRKRLVQESWALVEKDLDAHSVKFFKRIFEIAPGALQLFSFKDSKDLDSDPRMRHHASTVMKTVGTAVAGLNDLQSLIPVLQALGARHSKWGVLPEHFPVVGSALLWALEQGLGAGWTPEVREAWTETYGTVQSVMEPALVAANEKARQEGAGAALIKANAEAAAKAAAAASAPSTSVANPSVREGSAPVVREGSAPVAREGSAPVVREGSAPVSRLSAGGSGAGSAVAVVVPANKEKEERARLMKTLVQDSWKVVEKNIDVLAERFMKRVFRIKPELMDLFSFEDTPDVYHSEAFKDHAVKVLRHIGRAIMGLSDVKALVPVLKAHGAAHAAYGARPEHFAVFSKALLVTVEEGMGTQWTRDHREAWKKTYATIQSVMEPALVDAIRAAEHKPPPPQPPAPTPAAEPAGGATPRGAMGAARCMAETPTGRSASPPRATPKSPPLSPRRRPAANFKALSMDSYMPESPAASEAAQSRATPEGTPFSQNGTTLTPQSAQAAARPPMPDFIARSVSVPSPRDWDDQNEADTPEAIERMKQLVRDSFEMVSDDLEDFGVRIFMRMFRMSPKTLRLFSFHDNDALERIVKLKGHARVVMGVIEKVVANLDNVPALLPELQAVARAHAGRGVAPEYWDIFGKALVLTLHQSIPLEWTVEIQHAWLNAYEDVKEVIIDAMAEIDEGEGGKEGGAAEV